MTYRTATWTLLLSCLGLGACEATEPVATAPDTGAEVDAAVIVEDVTTTPDVPTVDVARDASVDRAPPPADRPDAAVVRDATTVDAPRPVDVPRPMDVVAVDVRPAVDVPTAPDVPGDRGPVDAGAPTDVPTIGGTAFSDAGAVMPTRTRVGPQSGGRVLFTSNTQRGSFWELPGGDVLTSFQTSRTAIRPGVAIYDLGYRMRRISGATVVPMPDRASGTCRDDGRLNGCDVGPDPDGPGDRSLVTADGTILLLERRSMSDGRSYPALSRLDPATGMTALVAEYTDLRAARADSAYDPPRALRQLGSGQLSLTSEIIGAGTRTLVLRPDGTRVTTSDGFAFGDRWNPFGLFMGETASYPLNRFRWWDARTGAASFVYALPAAEPGMSPPSFRTFVAASGDVLLPGNTYTDRLIHLGPDGRVVEDRAFTPSGFLGVYDDGAYLTYERYGEGDLGYALRVRNAAGVGTLLADDATLVRDAGWSPNPRGGFRYPYLLGARRAVIDHAGNAYIAYVLQTGGDSRTEAWLAAYARDGRRLWGLRIPNAGFGECLPRAVLGGRRLAVVCGGRYVNQFMLIGE